MQNIDAQNLNTVMKAIIASRRQHASDADDALIDLTLDLLKAMRLIALPTENSPAEHTTTPLPRAAGMPPAVPPEESVYFDFLVCLEDGKRHKMLKRHLNNAYGMTPDQYRQKWGLPSDYPMVAPSYAAQKRAA